jgi:hypothetical protein
MTWAILKPQGIIISRVIVSAFIVLFSFVLFLAVDQRSLFQSFHVSLIALLTDLRLGLKLGPFYYDVTALEVTGIKDFVAQH